MPVLSGAARARGEGRLLVSRARAWRREYGAALATTRGHSHTRPAEPDIGLTARERQIPRLIGDGLRSPEIAAYLVISEATVKIHINNLFG
jgi:DNA-binding NarL/FixJ family response regulator